jgi:hypothetical protein
MNLHLETIKNNLILAAGIEVIPTGDISVEDKLFKELLQILKSELVALVTTQEDKDKITAYFAEDV